MRTDRSAIVQFVSEDSKLSRRSYLDRLISPGGGDGIYAEIRRALLGDIYVYIRPGDMRRGLMHIPRVRPAKSSQVLRAPAALRGGCEIRLLVSLYMARIY